jgi:hypothetical protein
MPGFPSSFPEPGEAEVARYQKLLRILDPASNASPNEMLTARRAIEKLEADFPSIRLAAAREPSRASNTSPGAAREASGGWRDVLWETVREVVEAARTVATARMLAMQGVDVRTRVDGHGKVKLTITIDPAAVETVALLGGIEREQFVGYVSQRVTDELRGLFAPESAG